MHGFRAIKWKLLLASLLASGGALAQVANWDVAVTPMPQPLYVDDQADVTFTLVRLGPAYDPAGNEESHPFYVSTPREMRFIELPADCQDVNQPPPAGTEGQYVICEVPALATSGIVAFSFRALALSEYSSAEYGPGGPQEGGLDLRFFASVTERDAQSTEITEPFPDLDSPFYIEPRASQPVPGAVAPVPVMDNWALMLLASMLAAFGVARTRRRR